MIDVSGWRERQLALDQKAENARKLGLGYGCAQCGADGGTALYCVTCAEKYVNKGTRMSKEEALRLALEALELLSIETVCNGAHHAKKDRHEWLDPCPLVDRYKEAITAIKEALETKDEPFEYWNAVEGWVKIDEVREHFESASCGTIYKNGGEGRVPLYTTPQRTWVGLTDEERQEIHGSTKSPYDDLLLIEAKLKEKNI